MTASVHPLSRESSTRSKRIEETARLADANVRATQRRRKPSD